MPYAKTPLSPSEAREGRETRPVWLSEDPLATARGFVVGMIAGLTFWAIVILLAMVFS